MRYKKIAALVTAAALLLSGCSGLSEKRNLTYTDTLYDTVISVQILDPASEEILEGCEKLCKKYDTMFSMTNEESEIYKINHAGGAAVEVSQDTITLIKKGIYYSEMTNGAFDITIGAVSPLWDFKSEEPSVPSAETLASARSHVNYKNIILKDNTVKLLDPQAAIDVGAIAKGYIADRVKEYLEEEGVDHAIINLGGNVQTIGTKADGTTVYGVRHYSAPAYLQFELTRFKLDFVEPCGKIRALGVCPDFTEVQTRAWYDANRDLFTRYFGDSFSYEESRQIIEKRMREEVYDNLVQDILCESADRQ